MPTTTLTLDWRKTLIAAAALACALLAALFMLRGTTAHAQGQIKLEIKKTLEGSDLIRVGQEMTFTITIRNTGTISVTKLPLLDRYNSGILQLVRTTPDYSSHDTAASEIHWTDLTTDTLFGPLAPGDTIKVTTVFRAIHAAPETVNYAEIGAAEGMSGENGGGENDQDAGGAEGGHVILTKGLAPGQTPMVGKPITFTISIRNDGGADLVKIPVTDTFKPDYLAFISGEPAPSSVSANQLVWDDVLPLVGLTRLRPSEVITLTTVYTALKEFDGTGINEVGSSGTEDEFQNAVDAPKQDEVPVRIIGDASAAPTAAPTATPEATATPTPTPRRTGGGGGNDNDDTPTPTAALTATPVEITATAVATDTAGITATPAATTEITATAEAGTTPTATAVIPARLPVSGGGEASYAPLLLLATLLLGGGALAYRTARRGSR